MPTSVSLARQCLTPEAAHALDEAVGVARRRGHAQTTSLHAVSAMLSLPSSLLRDACARARNSAYSARLQFKALELCLSVSLDRVPSTQLADDPPVSNSLMAAIKRSQANQRRQPENFQLYQQLQQQSSSSISCIKVELQHLILSILDDPVVSRVFGEAGFRSCDIKLAIVRPLPQLLRYSRSRGPPLFLCNFIDSDPGRRSFSFPYSGFFTGDDNCKRIGEVLGRGKGRNPLLVGVCAYDALQSFTEMVEKGRYNILPVEISGWSIICIEKDVLRFFNENCDQGLINSRFEEVGVLVQHCLGAGLVVNFGDLKVFIDRDDASVGVVSYVVSQLTRLLEIHGGKLRLMGAVSSYETYLKFLNRYPSIEKDWDLQLLPITSLRPPMGEPYARSSLMESFVPLGGFFSSPCELKGQLSGSYQFTSRCHQCNEKCEQEVAALSKGGFTASVADQYQPNLPAWLQMAELGKNTAFDVAKAKDDGMLLLNAKIMGLQKKWDNICQRLQHTQPFPKADFYRVGSQVPSVVGFQAVKDSKENADNHRSSKTNASPSDSGCKHANSCVSMDLQKVPESTPSTPLPLVSKNESFLSKLFEKSSKTEEHEPGGLQSRTLSTSSVGDGRTSPTSVNSVTTDLGLGLFCPPSKQLKKDAKQTHLGPLPDFSSRYPANVDLVNGSISNPSSSCSCPDSWGQSDQRDFKTLFRALTERIDWQHEAISVISETIAHCRLGNEKRHGASPKGDIWFNFVGPDRFSKKKIAVALAEILYGRRESFICVDLSSQDGMIHKSANHGSQEMNGYNVKFRGKNVVDYIAGELSKKPLSVVFLENVDQADLLAQNSLFHAINTGKFCDSHGREVSINNATFVTTARFRQGDKVLSSGKEPAKYSEERISRAKGLPMQILIGYSHRDDDHDNFGRSLSLSITTNNGISNQIFLNKRKLVGSSETLEQSETSEMAKRAHKASNTYLDLNLPAEENEGQDADHVDPDNDDSSTENPRSWLQHFSDQIDETVVFKPFDFDALAEKVLREISKTFHETIGPESLLEINTKVMEQILAAACSSDRTGAVGDWVEQVLSRGFAEARKRYNLTAHCVVKLVPCEGIFMEDQAPGVWLPSRIILN
ncbi:protein SMAX1-LIKE 7-like [Vitis riparia]|uniref:protein SMAX1-LIKE 7-like n=1 Tax=Vitis riparia TaxID=96939 RepID=UPI00155AAAC5|nr:protein SMAX1-LIKE 7-like [Vitis riparia]